MESFNQMYLGVQADVQDYDATSLSYIKSKINEGQNILESALGSYYTEETLNRTSKANTGIYKNPVDIVRLRQAFVVVGTTKYDLEQVFDEDLWQYLKTTFYLQYDDAPTHIIVRRDTFEIFPALKTAGYIITLTYEAGGGLLQYDDYTDGTITTLTTATDDVVGNGTTWTEAMEGRYFKINADGNWYKIDAFLTATTITLDRDYQGLSIAAGTDAYTIGQIPRTPGPTHHIPCIYAKWQYYSGFKQNSVKATELRSEYTTALKDAKETYGKRYASSYIPGRSSGRSPYNSNYPPRNLT